MDDEAEKIERYYKRLKQAQLSFGIARFELGVLLHEIKTKELWRGKATSFAGFLEEERINHSAAYQFMRVANKFFFELSLPDHVFNALAGVNMRVLDTACRVITEENMVEVIGIVLALGERDAMLSLQEMQSPDKEQSAQNQNNIVGDVLRRYRSLPDELRLEFLAKVIPNGQQAAG